MNTETRDEETEAAVAYLLSAAMLDIRFQLADLPHHKTPDQQRMHNAWMLADLCHNLPAWLHPSRRARVREGLEWAWRTASDPKRAWMRYCWGEIRYDYSWLPDQPDGPASERPFQDPDYTRNDLGKTDHQDQ